MRTIFLLAALALGGCAAYSGPVAEDPVCRAEGDLGCVRVRIRKDTPKATYKGETYYFCNPRCRDRFLENPEAYLSR